jgi:two-component system, NarL family, sensor histidine kinase UhpB
MVYLRVLFLLLGLLSASYAQPAPTVLVLDQASISRDAALVPGALTNSAAGPLSPLPDDWRGDAAALPAQQWYHLVFDDGGWALPTIYLERACTNLEVWVNGQLVGSGGAMVEPLTRNCYYPHLVRFQRALLQAQGNRLDIRVVGYPQAYVASRQRGGGLSQVRIGEQSELVRQYDARYFWNIVLAQVIGIGMLLIGVVFVAMGWTRRQDRHSLYFGCVLLLWAGMGVRLYVQNLPLAGHAAEILFTALYAPLAYVLAQFLMHYVRQPRPWVQHFFLWQCVVLPALLVLVPQHFLAHVASAFYLLLGCEFVLVIAFFARHSWMSMRQDFWLMGACLMLLLVLASAEISVQSGWLALPKVHLMHFAMPLFFLAIGLRLVQKFAAALAESERLNRELERRVADKTAEIEKNYAQLSSLRAEQAATAERQRIASDLHDDLGAQLVTMAQASLYANDIGRVAELARQALADMRLAVRGLTGEPTPLPYVLADWRAETVERLSLAGVTVVWNANDPAMDWMLPARVQVQLTRILREAVSNVIRHSCAHTCWVGVHVAADQLQMGVEDDGQGFDTRNPSPGQGLGNLVTRARALQGILQIVPREAGGTCVRLTVPLAFNATASGLEEKGARP